MIMSRSKKYSRLKITSTGLSGLALEHEPSSLGSYLTRGYSSGRILYENNKSDRYIHLSSESLMEGMFKAIYFIIACDIYKNNM